MTLVTSCSESESQNILSEKDKQELLSEINSIDNCNEKLTLNNVSFEKEKILGKWELEKILDFSSCKTLSNDEENPILDKTIINFKKDGEIIGKTTNELFGDYTLTNNTLKINRFGGTKIGEFKLQNIFRDNITKTEKYVFTQGSLLLFTDKYLFKLNLLP